MLALPLLAQDDLPSGEVDVIKSFDARLGSAERVLVRPELPPLDSNVRRQNYNIQPRTTTVDYLPPKIRPLAFRTEKPEEGYNGYIRLGAGTPLAFYGEGSYDFVDSDVFNIGIDLLRHSMDNNSNVENQKFSRNHFGADATYYADQGFAVQGNVGFNTKTVHYYGYNDLNEELGEDRFSFQREAVRQRFNMFDLGGRIFNGDRTVADFNYEASVGLYLLEDNFAARENGFDLVLSGTKWFDETHPLNLTLKTTLTNYKDTTKQSLNNFSLAPNYTYHGDAFKIKVGLNLASSDDEFSFFPDVEASATLVEGVVDAFVGATGDLQQNNLRTLSDYNPFIRTRLRVRNSRFYEYYGGVKGNISGITYRAQAGLKNVDNLALFQLGSATDSIATFNVLYDTASIVTIKGTLEIPLFDNLDIIGTVSQNFFSLDREDKPWHLPSLSVNASAVYTDTENNFVIRGDFFLENGVPFLNSQGEADNLNTLFDVSVSGELFFTDNFGAFLQINNLANNKRQRWFRYPTFGLNFLAGVTAKF